MLHSSVLDYTVLPCTVLRWLRALPAHTNWLLQEEAAEARAELAQLQARREEEADEAAEAGVPLHFLESQQLLVRQLVEDKDAMQVHCVLCCSHMRCVPVWQPHVCICAFVLCGCVCLCAVWLILRLRCS